MNRTCVARLFWQWIDREDFRQDKLTIDGLISVSRAAICEINRFGLRLPREKAKQTNW